MIVTESFIAVVIKIPCYLFSDVTFSSAILYGHPMNLFNKNFYKFLFSFAVVIALTLMVVLLVGVLAGGGQ